MGFFDYLLFGALINSIRNSGRSNSTHSSFSNDSYNLCWYHRAPVLLKERQEWTSEWIAHYGSLAQFPQGIQDVRNPLDY